MAQIAPRAGDVGPRGSDVSRLIRHLPNLRTGADLPLQEGNERWHAGSAALLRGSKGNTYEGGMRVPCIARWPGQIRPGQVSADIASTLDFFPTLVEAAGGTVPQDREIDGRDILPFLRSKAPSPVTEFFYCRSINLEAVRDRNWKLRLSRHARDDLEKGQPLTPELFDLNLDPSEQYNVAEGHPDIVARLEQRLRALGDELGAKVAPPLPP